MPLLRALDSDLYARFFVLWHRRAGKDLTIWNWFIKNAVAKGGLHYYLFPTYTQGKKILWDGMTNEGKRFLDFIPGQIVKSKNATEMKLVIHAQRGEAIIQIVGTDKYDSLRGSNPLTCVFSEYAYQNPMAWEVLSPILKLNKGKAVFVTTPFGDNHAKVMYEMAVGNKTWWTQNLTIDDTKLLTSADMELERAEGKDEDIIQQEYYNSFEAAIKGAYYADYIKQAKDENRVCASVYSPDLPVSTAWDIGYKDDTAIIFFQLHGKEIRIVDSYSASGLSMPEYIAILKSKPYSYDTHYFPFDARIKAMSSGKSTIDVAKEYGMDNIKLTPNLSVQDGINQARMTLKRCWFEKDKTKEVIWALTRYRREYDEKRKVYAQKPLHDETSHIADAFRYLSISIKDKKIDNEYSVARQSFIDSFSGTKSPIQDATPLQDYERAQIASKRTLIAQLKKYR